MREDFGFAGFENRDGRLFALFVTAGSPRETRALSKPELEARLAKLRVDGVEHGLTASVLASWPPQR